MKPTLQGWLASSQNPEQVANTVKGLVMGASSFIIFFATNFFHIALSAQDVVGLATGVSMIAGAIWFVYGLTLKVLVKVGSVR